MKQEEIKYQTKYRLSQALKSLMEKKGFNDITIKDLIDRADISRPTFYYHFKSTEELLAWMFENEGIELLKASENCITWDEGIALIFQYVLDNSKVCLSAFNSIGQKEMKKLFYSSVKAIVLKFIDTLLETIPAKKVHVDFIADFYTTAFAGILLSWLEKGMKETPEEMVSLLEITVQGNIAAALERSARL